MRSGDAEKQRVHMATARTGTDGTFQFHIIISSFVGDSR